MLKTSYCIDNETNNNIISEIGIDEAGRGPMLGRVYTAAVILPSDAISFNHAMMKDSKKFHSDKKIHEAAAYIKENAIAWAIAYSSETVIDEINIRNATHKAMHEAIKNIIGIGNDAGCNDNLQTKCIASKSLNGFNDNILLLVDGNDFTPYVHESNKKRISHVCIEGGDNTYSSIAAASILAKVSRDDYIAELCSKHPELITHYDLLKNKGYGTKKHMDGIKSHGITPFHRKTFGICREFA
jgi:ribonuclease HII